MDDDADRADCFSDPQPIPTTGFNRLVRARRGGKWWVLKSLKEPYLADPAYTGLLHKEADILSLVQGEGTPECKGLEEVPDLGTCIVMEWIDGISASETCGSNPGVVDSYRSPAMPQPVRVSRFLRVWNIKVSVIRFGRSALMPSPTCHTSSPSSFPKATSTSCEVHSPAVPNSTPSVSVLASARLISVQNNGT